MNRIKEFLADPAEEEPYGDFFVVSGEFGTACVTRETALDVERCLAQPEPPRWITFVDRVGSRITVRSRSVRAICESTEVQRAGDRRLDRARRREEKSDRSPWDDDN